MVMNYNLLIFVFVFVFEGKVLAWRRKLEMGA
jgi:hypothetical protein